MRTGFSAALVPAVAALAILVSVLALPLAASGQTLSNPDIAAIGDMRFVFRNAESADATGAAQTTFEFRELELFLGAYLNPYMRADVFIGIHGVEGPLDVEEAALTVLRGLPLSLQARAGKYILDFGRANQMHLHQFASLEHPLIVREYLGPEGLRPVGAQVSTLFGIGENAMTLSLNAISADAFANDHAHEEGAEEEEEEEASVAPRIMGSGRLSWFRQITDNWSADAGVSALYGTYDADEGLRKRIAGADLKFKWRPDSRRAMVLTAEWMLSDSDVAIATGDTLNPESISRIEAQGVFASAEFRFARRWDVGGYYDRAEDPDMEGATTVASGIVFGFMPAEETARFSIVYRHETSDLFEFTDQSLTFQVLWSLGPHRPHTF